MRALTIKTSIIRPSCKELVNSAISQAAFWSTEALESYKWSNLLRNKIKFLSTSGCKTEMTGLSSTKPNNKISNKWCCRCKLINSIAPWSKPSFRVCKIWTHLSTHRPVPIAWLKRKASKPSMEVTLELIWRTWLQLSRAKEHPLKLIVESYSVPVK
jgi:hypothetical protein